MVIAPNIVMHARSGNTHFTCVQTDGHQSNALEQVPQTLHSTCQFEGLIPKSKCQAAAEHHKCYVLIGFQHKE